jgi:NHLM bacteriocin system ABC transporter ATP-binding protein
MLASLTDLTNCGRVLETGPNQPFPVHDAGSMWIVEAGNLDLYLMSTNERDLIGARHHVGRLEAGEAVFGVGYKKKGEMALVACASPNARIRWIPATVFYDDPAREEHLITLLDRWIEHLYLAFTKDCFCPNLTTFEPEEDLAIGEESSAVIAKEGVLWINHRKGGSAVLGRQLLDEQHRLFPICRYGWLTAAPESLLSAVDTKAAINTVAGWNVVQQFHSIVMSLLSTQHYENEACEKERLQQRAEADARLLHNALLQIASPLAAFEEEVEFDPEPFNEPLFLACNVIGKQMGIKMKPHPDMVRGIKLKDAIGSIAKASGIRVRRVALRGNWWSHDNGPLLAFREADNQPVALLTCTPGAYDIYDPVQRKKTRLSAEQAATLSPFAYLMYRPFPHKNLGLGDILLFGAKGCRSELLTIIAMGLLTGALSLLMPYGTGIIFDSIIPGAERYQLVQLAVILVISAISVGLFSLASSMATLRLEGKMDAAIQAAVWDRLLNLPVPFFRDYTAGDLATRSLAINEIRRALTGTTLTYLLSGLFSIFSFGLLFYYDWRLALLASVLVGSAVLFSSICGYFIIKHQRGIYQLRGRISGMVLQFVTGIAKLRGTGTEHHAFASWSREFAQQKQLALRSRHLSNLLMIFNSVFPVICWACIFYYHNYLSTEPNATRLSTGDFLAFNAAFTQFLMSSLLISNAAMVVISVVPLYERSRPIFNTLPEISAANGSPGKLTGAIELSHVHFRYRQDAPLVLHDLSISIEPGQYVAFVGPSGSGKSTVLRMLLGFDIPESGAVYFDRQDLSNLDIQEVRRQMGVVLQNGRLVSGDIFTNIVGSAPLTLDDAWIAAEMAGIDADIKRLPMGMHTMLSESGGGLSGGQKQRLMIARAIVHRPRILLFDEATSALDNQTQAIVSRSMEMLQATRIVIAHRLSTIVNADHIFVVDKGQVVQSGTYNELFEQEGLFRELARRQLV